MNTNDNILYHEELSSKRTQRLFAGLTTLFLLLSIWRVKINGMNWLAAFFLILSGIFLFYMVNYRTLIIRITADSLRLSFGIFTWAIPFDNIESCSIDEIPAFNKYGGAGIHFMFVEKRYRVSFNFLEYPRLVIAFKKKVGPVRDISFSTRQPEDVMRVINTTS